MHLPIPCLFPPLTLSLSLPLIPSASTILYNYADKKENAGVRNTGRDRGKGDLFKQVFQTKTDRLLLVPGGILGPDMALV